MFEKLINTIVQRPLLWNVTIPLAIITIFCIVLFWEGIYGHATRLVNKIRGVKPADKSN